MERRPGGRQPDRSDVREPALTTEPAPTTARPLPVEPPVPVIFDRRDGDVTPPLMQRVRLRSVARPGLLAQATSEQTGLVEVVVSVAGTVESAKFVTRPVNVHESMLLSAVKTWRFRPAMRNGQALRYRLTVPIGKVRV